MTTTGRPQLARVLITGAATAAFALAGAGPALAAGQQGQDVACPTCTSGPVQPGPGTGTGAGNADEWPPPSENLPNLPTNPGIPPNTP
ncbi:hypothetical protein [Pseudonocardia sp. HH130630-07]|uniref:hypothetical protein n=1 Tax=Pseudonocardia sp. HH130630-07 TaxID=1690815 RepID=UPI0012EAB338|nr:hypothetical protein [Pseudonocardia sp. HH130630-07]